MTLKLQLRRPARAAFLVFALLGILVSCAGSSPAPARGDEPPETGEAHAPVKRALLVGINQYDVEVPDGLDIETDRHWRNLKGAVNDVQAVGAMLKRTFEFEDKDVTVLTDESASRAEILAHLDLHLVENARRGDTVVFYFSGHGSQVHNENSHERDQLDETIVPADSKLGADDIRDKELRLRFNRILDRGAQLVVVLDSCHSGSGARDLEGSRVKALAPVEQLVRDLEAGPDPETRGALIWSASRDFENAYESQYEAHGAFTLAWLRALGDAGPQESADYVFRRTRGRLLAEPGYQEPVLAGMEAVKAAPIFGGRVSDHSGRAVAIEDVRDDGSVVLQGGWAQGLAVGSQLRRVGTESGPSLEVTRILGWGRSEARRLESATSLDDLTRGKLVEAVNWVAPRGKTLRVALNGMADTALAESVASSLHREVQGSPTIAWVDDSTLDTPSHILEWVDGDPVLVRLGGGRLPLGTDNEAYVARILQELRSMDRAKIFVRLPVPTSLTDLLDLGAGSPNTVVEPVAPGELAHYYLVGRHTKRGVQYAWLRGGITADDADRSILPARSRWFSAGNDRRSLAGMIEERILRAARIFSWLALEAPPALEFPYRLGIVETESGDAADRPLRGGGRYGLELVRTSRTVPVRSRHVYVFVIDSEGNGVLLYPSPESGAVENQHPPPPRSDAPERILLGRELFEATEPYGNDSFFLLTSAEPIVDPLGVFEFEGISRGDAGRGHTSGSSLEDLLLWTHSTVRGASRPVPNTWSLERTTVAVGVGTTP